MFNEQALQMFELGKPIFVQATCTSERQIFVCTCTSQVHVVMY